MTPAQEALVRLGVPLCVACGELVPDSRSWCTRCRHDSVGNPGYHFTDRDLYDLRAALEGSSERWVGATTTCGDHDLRAAKVNAKA